MINQAIGCFIGSLVGALFVFASFGFDKRDRKQLRIGIIICLSAAFIFGLEATLLN